MAQPNRLPAGGLVDRAATLRFTFDGRAYEGHPGDTLASALVANGVRLLARSFKYHRPRGLLSAGSEEPNAIFEMRSGSRREPNTRATTIELYDGLEAASQNRWPSLSFDLLGATSFLSPVFVAGFYYKTFMWPAAAWEKFYEPLIRRAAGLGRGPDRPDPDHYEKAHLHCDVLVIGAGPAGLAAALAAGRTGARVVLCDEDFSLGGRLAAERLEIDGDDARQWAGAAEAELAAMPEVRILRRTTVFGVYDHGVYGAVERVADHLPAPPPHVPRQRSWRIVAKRAVLAAGAIERPLVFGDNDRPGIMLAGAVRAYLNRFAAAPGRRLVVYTAGDDGWRTATDAIAAGLAVEAVVDARAEVPTGPAAAVRKAGGFVFPGGAIVGVAGRHGVERVTIRGSDGMDTRHACDLVAMSNGWSPALHLTCHLGGKPRWDDALSAFVPDRVPPGMTVAGAAAGAQSLAAALRTGAEAGAAAAAEAGFDGAQPPLPRAQDEPVAIRPLWHVLGRGKAFVDFQNDVTAADIGLAAREGYRSVEHTKRYTTLGMGTDQGKTANVNGLAVLAQARGEPIPAVGTTVFRPPYTPVAIGALAGHHRGRDYKPVRHTPSHAWAAEQGAVFVEAGLWLRAQWFPKPGERDWLESVTREVRAVRGDVGFCDVSTLGKIDVQGPDAGAFLDRVYANTMSTLPVGKVRYGVMLREDGFVFDDGTAARLGAEHFLVTTTTANAIRAMQHLEFCHQVLWPELDVQMVSTTEHWAQVSVAGPRSRELLQGLVDRDLSNEAFPYMAAGAVNVGGVAGRIFRISFSGELAYEIAVPARRGDALVRALAAAGATPYGTEALSVMRIEKGHVAGGELNGQTTARDLGLGKMLSTKKDFVGRAMAARAALNEPERPILVGFKPVDPAQRLHAGAHFIPLGAEARAENDQGHMSSVAFSPGLGHWIGLGFLRDGRTRIGERVRAVDLVRGRDVEVEIADPVFVDPAGERLRA